MMMLRIPRILHNTGRYFLPQRFPRVYRRRARYMASTEITYLGQQAAVQLDKELMGKLSFSIDQLMELAGLSVASAIQKEYPASKFPRVLVVVGPGNNGGDGLVAARHLTLFGHTVQTCIPVPTNNMLYNNLHMQCEAMGAKDALPTIFQGTTLQRQFDLVVDAMFGFSFKGSPRPPFDQILKALVPARKPPTLVSVDIPSGWNVEEGDVAGDGIQPDMLISLSAPKLCAQKFKGKHHYLGGRFLPPSIIQQFDLNLPPYPQGDQCVKLNPDSELSLKDMRIEYKTAALEEETMLPDPLSQFHQWLEEFKKVERSGVEANAIVVATCGSNGKPSARVVLLKEVNHDGFVFFTNYESKKGNQLNENQKAAICLYMGALTRQVRVEGTVKKISEEKSTEYFHSRPRSSQVGAWASAQSTILANRQELESKLKEMQEKFEDESEAIPRPPYWGGFLILPETVEFWQGGESRLHDRLEYYQEGSEGGWKLRRLSP